MKAIVSHDAPLPQPWIISVSLSPPSAVALGRKMEILCGLSSPQYHQLLLYACVPFAVGSSDNVDQWMR